MTPVTGQKRKSLPGAVADYHSKKQRPKPLSRALISESRTPVKMEYLDDDFYDKSKQTGHRPVTSCTFCRQHKIKCNASENYPSPCQRCERMGLKCEIDPQFRPKKGSQIQLLKSDVDELKVKIEMLSKNETLLIQALNQHNSNFMSLQRPQGSSTNGTTTPNVRSLDQSPSSFVLLPGTTSITNSRVLNDTIAHGVINDSTSTNLALNDTFSPQKGPVLASLQTSDTLPEFRGQFASETLENAPQSANSDQIYAPSVSEFILGDVRVPLEKAHELHDRFMEKYHPFMPIIALNLATELYQKLQLLFWLVMLTAALLEPEPTLYMSLASLIKQLAIETCWIRTPRSTHVIQALVILAVWPLPNEKILDDCLYRFTGLAKNLALQLGLHRGGEFIQEFSRTQVSLGPDAERWRTRAWLAIFFCEQFWLSVLGLPPSINTTDYLLENARVDGSLPKSFRCLMLLAIFQCKLVNVMGILVTRSDGLLEPSNRAGSLNILDRELERLKFKLNIEEGSFVEVYYLYVKLMICGFAFLPGTPIEDQVKYVSGAYLAATRVITTTLKMMGTNMLMEMPIYVRQAISYSVLMLFKLHLLRYLYSKYVDSARQSIVTVHRLLRNTLLSWKDLQNDISRTAKVLENLNIVLYTYPDVFEGSGSREAGAGSIITRMRSHLTASLFYDLVWCVHEARRRTVEDRANPPPVRANKEPEEGRKAVPLPFYNQITKDDFKTITTTTPNGTTITTLVPTDEAMLQARLNANSNGNRPLEINGIPLAMLEATGSMRELDSSVKREADDLGAFSGQIGGLGSPEGVPNEKLLVGQSDHLGGLPQALEPSKSPLSVQFAAFGGSPQPAVADQMDNFFQQQSSGWLNNNNYQDDDFFGWFDENMIAET